LRKNSFTLQKISFDQNNHAPDKRRDLRRQRRTLRSKKFRRQWFAKELAKLGLPKSETALDDPISLRLRALNGETLKPEELHAALTHLRNFADGGFAFARRAWIHRRHRDCTHGQGRKFCAGG
jgi:hypothetical protein